MPINKLHRCVSIMNKLKSIHKTVKYLTTTDELDVFQKVCPKKFTISVKVYANSSQKKIF